MSILSLIDGMEKFAKEQIATTTSLNMISITTNTFRQVNGINVRKDSASFLQYEEFIELTNSLTRPAKTYLYQRIPREISLEGDTVKTAAHVNGVAGLIADTLVTGRTLTEAYFTNRTEAGVLTESLAIALAGNGPLTELIGKTVLAGGRRLTIVGIIGLKYSKGPELFFPFTVLPPDNLKNSPPHCVVEAEHVTDVPVLKEQIEIYLNQKFAPGHDFNIATNELRVEQASKGFRLFRIIMGLIVGISVIVGGVGIMNVLLISVTQRTAEIGIRKVAGANKRDIVLLFLTESIAVSAFGSFLGLIVGVLFTLTAVPLVNSLTGVAFQAAYTWNTFLVVSILAIILGIVFGTYPAMRASRLTPVDAIRHE